MGNILALEQKKQNRVNEEIPYLKQMQLNAKKLASSFEAQSLLDINYPIDNTSNNYSIFEQVRQNEVVISQEGGDNLNFSETSPFISSELYNSMINQQGGADSSSYSAVEETSNNNSDDDDNNSDDDDDMIKKMINEDTGSTGEMDKEVMDMISSIDENNSSSTSDSDDEEKNRDKEAKMLSLSSNGSMGSYLSSSAHTDGVDSSSENVTTISMKNRNLMSDSINTSDINMISVEE